MKILGIETSCDETGVAIVEDGQKILANVVSSSVSLHQKYGGVVPEIAAREQVKVIIPAIEESLSYAKTTWGGIDALAVTIGPGLVGSLLVGVETAKTLGVVFKKPVIPVNHLVGHIYANFIRENSKFEIRNSKLPQFPLIALIVSGGHTDLVLMRGHNSDKWLGGTRDDAAGEAFDKVARVLGLGYPGGPEIEKATKDGDPKAFNFPRPMINSANFDFSFSGLKTAVVNLIKATSHKPLAISDVAASFQAAIVDVLVTKTIRAAKKYQVKQILIGGGVAANKLLRNKMRKTCNKIGISVKFPPVELCIDNGAMVASAAFYNFKPVSIAKIQAQPGLHF